MNDFKETVKQWLKENGKDRFWLANQCFVVKGTVDDWMKKGKVIPASKVKLIEKIITSYNATKESSVSIDLNAQITLNLSQDEYNSYVIHASNMNMTLAEWIDHALKTAGENPNEVLKKLGIDEK